MHFIALSFWISMYYNALSPNNGKIMFIILHYRLHGYGWWNITGTSGILQLFFLSIWSLTFPLWIQAKNYMDESSYTRISKFILTWRTAWWPARQCVRPAALVPLDLVVLNWKTKRMKYICLTVDVVCKNSLFPIGTNRESFNH